MAPVCVTHHSGQSVTYPAGSYPHYRRPGPQAGASEERTAGGMDAAEEALWAARREYRRDPEAAVARLETLDVDGLPEDVARQVFGEWARTCARLCRERGIAAGRT